MLRKAVEMNPKISIIVPVYNSELYLGQCIESILSQTYTNFECILINDCSGDNSLQICNNYKAQDQRIKIISNRNNMGSSLTRKIGVENSCGEYIQFIDSDDWIEADMLEQLYNKAISLNLDIIYCYHVFFNETGEYPQNIYDTRGKKKQEIINDLISDNFYGMLWFKLFKRKLFSGIIFPILQFCEDRVINLQLFLSATKIGYVYSILYHQRRNPISLVNNPIRRKINAEEGYKNMIFLNDIIKKRSDYDLYETAMELELNRLEKIYKPAKVKTSTVFFKKAIKAILPYGFIRLYQKFKNRH